MNNDHFNFWLYQLVVQLSGGYLLAILRRVVVLTVCESVHICYGFRGHVPHWGSTKSPLLCFTGIPKTGGSPNSGITDD